MDSFQIAGRYTGVTPLKLITCDLLYSLHVKPGPVWKIEISTSGVICTRTQRLKRTVMAAMQSRSSCLDPLRRPEWSRAPKQPSIVGLCSRLTAAGGRSMRGGSNSCLVAAHGGIVWTTSGGLEELGEASVTRRGDGDGDRAGWRTLSGCSGRSSPAENLTVVGSCWPRSGQSTIDLTVTGDLDCQQ
jgi:hypothetical protein